MTSAHPERHRPGRRLCRSGPPARPAGRPRAPAGADRRHDALRLGHQRPALRSEAHHPVRAGERVRLSLVNRTMMWHPVYLHGHTFQLGRTGPRKDTVTVLPHQHIDVDFDADNPGVWMYHCHNAYHAETGMMGLLGYRR